MRKVVDSNYLQKPELRQYLSASKQNTAVLTDYAAMEAYKGDTLASIYKSLSVLAEFPLQVVVLKNTLVACGLSGRGSGLQQRLIDTSQTRGFSVYCDNLAAAKLGNMDLQRQLLEHGREATRHLEERMLADAGSMPTAIEYIAATYTNDELAALRTAARYSDETVKKLIASVLYIALNLFQKHPSVRNLPKQKEMPNTFIFRAALCAYLLALEWISVAGAHGAKAARATTMRNDIVDVNFAAYATFFDGLLSSDAKVQRIYLEARILLATVFGCHIAGSP